MARFQVPEIVTHANIRPLLARLLEEPWFKIGARPKGPWPKDAWFYREAILEVPLGELAQGGLNTMALVGRSPYTTAPLTGKEGFNAQGLEGKALIRKPLFNALMNMRDLIGVHRGRIITRRLDDYAAGQKVDRNPGRYSASRNPDLSKLTDKQLYRLWVRLDNELRKGGGGQYGYDRPTLKITRPALYAKLIPVLDEVAFRGLDKNPGRNPARRPGEWIPVWNAERQQIEFYRDMLKGHGVRAKMVESSYVGAMLLEIFTDDLHKALKVAIKEDGQNGSLAYGIRSAARTTGFKARLRSNPGDIKVLAGPFKDRREAARQRNIQARRGHKGIVKVISIPDAGLWYVICQRSKWERPGKNPGVHKSPPFRIQYLPANQVWVMTWGDQIIDIRGVRSFPSKAAAIAAAKAAGIKVDPKTGICKNPGAAWHADMVRIHGRMAELAKAHPTHYRKSSEFLRGESSAHAFSAAEARQKRRDNIQLAREARKFPQRYIHSADYFRGAADAAKNPGPAYHRREQARYFRLLAGDLKAKHKDAAEYWQGALSAEAASVAAGKVTRNPARRDLIAKAVLKFYKAQPDHIKKLMGRMSPEQLVLFVRKHSK